MSTILSINEFFEIQKDLPVVDVRSPKEYMEGHIPGSINIPLFDNEERAIVGTLYKKTGRNAAILTGLDIVGVKLKKLAETALKIAPDKRLIIHCWRGGMRSSSMAWLFETCGIFCYVLEGGYKSYRRFIHNYFAEPFKLIILGGMTGSGKSAMLAELSKQSYQVIKLEELAHHKGSAFGRLGETEQSSNEQFENDLFTSLRKLDISKYIFVEDESRNIGHNIIPLSFFETMAISPLIIAEMSKELRISRLVNDYGGFDKSFLKDSLLKISKRLGGLNTQNAISSLDEDKPEIAAGISLLYYDKTYNFGLTRKRNKIKYFLKLESSDEVVNTRILIEHLKEKGLL